MLQKTIIFNVQQNKVVCKAVSLKICFSGPMELMDLVV
jgi:hypothetical protein